MPIAQIDIGSAFPPARVPEFQSLSGVVSSLLPKILILGGVIFFVIIVITGLGVIMNAGGDEHAVESRKNILTYAVIGFIIMFAAYWILQIINFITKGSLSGILG